MCTLPLPMVPRAPTQTQHYSINFPQGASAEDEGIDLDIGKPAFYIQSSIISQILALSYLMFTIFIFHCVTVQTSIFKQ